MTSPATLHAILARLEAASGPDRELDAAIDIAVNIPNWALGYDLEPWAGGKIGVVGHPHTPAFWTSPHYTASLDAAVALVAKVLPGWWWDICTYEPGRYEAFINPPEYRDPDEHPCGMGIDETPARAIVRAVVRALISVEERARSEATPDPAPAPGSSTIGPTHRRPRGGT